MKKIGVLIIYALFSLSIMAQQQTEYNKKGDEAMQRRDYSDARLFYSEGVLDCDMYSIYQLTEIWLSNERMRMSMHNLMSRCLLCLNKRAEENDTTAISKLIIYYTEGIGTPRDEDLVIIWEKRLEEINRPVLTDNIKEKNNEPKERMEFFAGYSFSTLAPYGITVGGVSERFGWYARFKTNASFQGADEEFNGLEPSGASGYLFPVKKKVNSYMGTAGLVVKCTPWLYASAGVGYGSRELLYLYSQKDDTGMNEIKQIWFKNLDASYSGFSAEIDFMVKIGAVYVSAGCSTLSFDYIDLNAGVGVFF